MSPRRSLAVSFFTAALLASTTSAQEISLSSDTARVGDTIDVTYSNRHMAGQVVVIEITNGDPFKPVTLVFEVRLNARGEGTFSWVVPAWAGAEVSGPQARDEFLFIS